MSKPITPISSNGAFTPEFYDEVYFETGTMSGKSCYSYYRWMPEPTFRMAMAIIEHAKLGRGKSFLDFGCAKGYLVKAMRYLFREGYGCDWSEYAIRHVDPEVKEFVRLSSTERPIPFDEEFHLCVAKDVLEHVPYQDLPGILKAIREKTEKLLAVAPLGDGKRYIIEEYERDQSHFIRESVDWWVAEMEKAGFKLISAAHHVPGIKDSWYGVNSKGNTVLLVR